MSVVAVNFMGRFGNNLFQYAFARAYAEKHGHEFQCDPWIGQQVFQLDDKPITATNLQTRDENNIQDGEGDIVIRSYCQQQKCLIYTQSQIRSWFKFQHWVNQELYELPTIYRNAAHRRVGDYVGYSFPLVSIGSYLGKFLELGIGGFSILTEENPIKHNSFQGELSFVPDFYCMAHADVLLRGNSTFSWWAAALNRHGRIYSPVMEGCEGGKEHDVEFVDGNWPRFRDDLDFITNLHLSL